MDPIRYVCRRQHADRMDQTIGEKQSPQCIQKNESRLLTCAFVPMVTHKNPSQVRSYISDSENQWKSIMLCARERFQCQWQNMLYYSYCHDREFNLEFAFSMSCSIFIIFSSRSLFCHIFFHSLSITISRQYNSTKHKKMNWEIFSHVASSVHSRR